MEMNIWKNINENIGQGVKMVAQIPMTEKDREVMKAEYEQDYSNWVIALIEEESGYQTVSAWGVDENGMSDSDTSHLYVEGWKQEGDMTATWYEWVQKAQQGLVE